MSTAARPGARRKLPRFLFEYIDGGSYGETTLRRNVDDLAGIALRQRVLRDVSQIDLSTELFGARQAMPVALAPIGLAGLNARRGECQAVLAAEKAGVAKMLGLIEAEMRVAMALTGVTRIDQIGPQNLADCNLAADTR